MFEARKAARSKKKNKDVTALLELQKNNLISINEKLAAAEAAADPAEKILKLEALAGDIRYAEYRVSSQETTLVNKRARKKMIGVTSASALGGAAVIAVPAVLLFPPLLPAAIFGLLGGEIVGLASEDRIKNGKRKQVSKKNPTLADFAKAAAVQMERTQTLLDETVATCSLEEVTLSPFFKEVLGSNGTLRERFADAAATAAQQALEEKNAPKEGPAPAKKPARKAPPKRVVKPVGDYGHLKQ